MIVENKHIIPVQKRKEANKRPHGSNFHMKSEVPDGFRAPVFKRVSGSVCKTSERERERERNDDSKRWFLYFQQGQGSCGNYIY